MLFSMGGLFSIYEDVHKLHDTEPVKYAWVAVVILGFGVVAESVSLWGCYRAWFDPTGSDSQAQTTSGTAILACADQRSAFAAIACH